MRVRSRVHSGIFKPALVLAAPASALTSPPNFMHCEGSSKDACRQKGTCRNAFPRYWEHYCLSQSPSSDVCTDLSPACFTRRECHPRSALCALKYLIRSPVPLDPERAWRDATEASRPRFSWLARRYPPHFIRKLYVGARLRLDHDLAVATHYDASNELFGLILDRRYLFYSRLTSSRAPDARASPGEQGERLHQAALPQTRGTDPRPRVRLGRNAQKNLRGDGGQGELVGLHPFPGTACLQHRQGLFDVTLTNFVTTTYPDAHYDKIYSIGAWEHVRPNEIPALLWKLFRALKPGGRLIQQFICLPSERMPTTVMIGEQTFFPGSALSSYKHQTQSWEAAGFGLISSRSMIIGRPSAPGLTTWSLNRDRAIALGRRGTVQRIPGLLCRGVAVLQGPRGFRAARRLAKDVRALAVERILSSLPRLNPVV